MKDIKPAIRFVAIFLLLYVGMNMVYGLWIKSYADQPDPATKAVTRQTSAVLNMLGEETTAIPNPITPSVSVTVGMRTALNVYEGCNGINVMIVFTAFLFAFGGSIKKMAWFIPAGLGLIYFFNLVRVVGLYYVAEYWSEYFYYIHKYAFTAFIYVLVLLLWWWWIEKINRFSLRGVLKS